MRLFTPLNKRTLNASGQEGAVLLISLIVLIVLTLVTFSSSKNVLLQGKMTSTIRQSVIISEAAELALIEAETAALTASYSLTGNAAGFSGFFRGDLCDTTVANCHLNTQQDLFADATWNTSSASASQGLDLGSETITGKYKVIYLGQKAISLTSDTQFTVIDSSYQSQNSTDLGLAYVFKVISMAEHNGSRKVFVSYFASVSGNFQPILI